MRWATFALLLLTTPLVTRADEPEVEYGFRAGERVPNAGMRVVFGEHDGKHTCLTGMYRNERAVSIYASTVDDDVFRVAKVVDERLQSTPGLRGFLLVFSPSKKREATTERVRALAEKHGLKRVDIAIGSKRTEWRNLDLDAKVNVVDSTKRRVTSAVVFHDDGITDESLKTLAAQLGAKPK